MNWLLDFVRDVLDPISTVIAIVTFFPVIWIWWDVKFGRKKRYNEWFQEVRRLPPGKRPSILIVDLHEKYDIQPSVEKHRQHVESLKSIPPDRIFRISREKWLTPDDMPDLTTEIKDKAAEIVHAGTDTLHLFYAGPVIPPAILGATLANTCMVILYQHTHQGEYVNWGPMRH